ncbi:MAG TPA: WD40 repeat domain-containing protein, partial [Intrasporangium sp.]|nr:WD40 repeat domain-containing protein [Intrasporangium sp.]
VPARQLTPGGGQNLVEVLVRARLVTVDDGVAALAHESLARAWPRLKGWLEDDLEGQRILRHLAGAADSWDALGRPDSELYRGVRLTRALDWRRRSATVLTTIETEFLDASERLDAEERTREAAVARRRRRQAMTTRGLVAGLTTFALVAGIAAAFGVRERDRAAEAAAAAQARAATVVAHESTDPTVAALAGVEAVRLRDGSDTRGALLSALTRWPALLASTAMTEVHDLAVDSSGALAIALGGDLSLRDPTSLAEVDRLAGAASAVAFLSDGRRLAAGSFDGGLWIIDRATGERREVPHRADGVWRVEASLTGEVWAAFLWSRSDNSSAVHVWRDTTHLWALPPGAVQDVGLSPDGSRLYLAIEGGVLEAYDVASGRQVARVALDSPLGGAGTGYELGPLEVNPDGRTLAVGGEQVLLVDASTLKVLRRMPNAEGATGSLSFSPDGTVLAGGSDERTVTLWDVRSARRERIEGLSEGVRSIAFSPGGATLYMLTEDGRLSAWDVRGDRRLVQRIVPPADRDVIGELVVPAPDGEAVAFSWGTPGSLDRRDTIEILDVASGTLLRPLVGTYQNWGVWQPPDAERLAVPGERWIRIWDWRSSRLVLEKEVGQGPIEALTYSPDGRRLVVGERAGVVYQVDAETLEPTGPRVPINGDLHELVWAGRGRVVVFVDNTRFVLVDVGSGRVLKSAEFGLNVTHADASPDGRLLAVGSEDGQFGILDLDSGEWLTRPAAQHQPWVGRVDFSSDGAIIVTTGGDGQVRLWDGRSGAPSGSITPGQEDVPSAAVFLKDSHTLLMATANGSVLSWDTRVESWVEHACQVARRNLTPQEWRGIFGDETPQRKTCPDV